MFKEKNIAVVIPAYNEQELINKTIVTIPDYVDYIIVIDDSSTDSTVKVIENIDNNKIVLLKHFDNRGVGASIVTGYLEAIKLAVDVVVVMGADAQMDPLDFESLISPVIDGSADYAKGNRFLYSDVLSAMPPIRILGNVFFSIISCIASGYYHIFDTQCGYTAINNQTLSSIDLDSLFPRYGFPTDMLAKLNNVSARVLDVPVRPVYESETSGIKPLSFTISMIKLTLRIFIDRKVAFIRKKMFFNNNLNFE
jgi:glycosyltransferase involved in cell wall biosynthesis